MGGGDIPSAKHFLAFTEMMVLCAGPEREQVLTESNTPISVTAAVKGAGSETGRPAFKSPSSPWAEKAMAPPRPNDFFFSLCIQDAQEFSFTVQRKHI